MLELLDETTTFLLEAYETECKFTQYMSTLTALLYG